MPRQDSKRTSGFFKGVLDGFRSSVSQRSECAADENLQPELFRILKMKAALSLKRLDSLVLSEKPEDLTRKDEMDWITKNSDAIAYIKLSLADEQAL
ncbi:hypothetical protein TNCV_4662111 [Trichonephila clavipes]|uniref:Uncharacterized protein n=1 Tax=Trichonephila clavipes TaxID=2585209 RepID=A0A8X6VK78_TRICX|nr:hypothetical protein TNCV_4662111 [Trichonephila clavipes]